jgi:glycosyltransferase involved in cell wall biosynthesis
MQRAASETRARMPAAFTLGDLPAPRPGRSGWPWTQGPAARMPPAMHAWPRITVITPSFNQARFLEETIRSVLLQGYPNLEYIVIDGGSTDGSIDIVRRYERWLDWVSEPDRGQTHAINKGLRRATGDWVAWQNSDDIYYPGAFRSLAEAASHAPGVELVIADVMLIDADSHPLRDVRYVRPSFNALRAEGMVLTNQAAFWRRAVHAEIGYLDESMRVGFDYDWFLRLTRAHRAAHVAGIWGALRLHAETKSSTLPEQFQQEYARALDGFVAPAWMRRAYQFRRLLLMLAQGDLRYVLRGLYRRARRRPELPAQGR